MQTKHSQTQLHKEESLFFAKGMLIAPLPTAGMRDEVAQGLQMSIYPQMLEDVEEPMLARPATLGDSSESALVLNVRLNLEDVFHHVENSRKSMQLCLNVSLTTGTWVTEALCRSRASSWKQAPLLEPST